MSTPKPVNVARPVSWDEAKPALALALADYLDGAGREVEQGAAFPFAFGEAMTLLRAEGSELVVVGYQGKHTLAANAFSIVSLAKQTGAQSIRVHTHRRGEMRFLNRLGLPFELAERRRDEFVLRCQI